jgi:hypothetical protein
MSDVTELRDLDEARRFLVQGLWWQRAVRPGPGTVRPALEWALEIAAAGHPLPPVGVVADLGHIAFGSDRDGRPARETDHAGGLEPGLMRAYEDHVLGKVYADFRFERASDALRGYQGRDRARGLAFVVERFRQRAGFGGVLLTPGLIRTLLEGSPEEVLAQGLVEPPRPWMPLLKPLYEGLVAAARRTAEVLADEDVVQLEHRTALADLGQQVAELQVLRTASRLESLLPRHKVKPLAGRQEVPTRVLDEDTYPVGGFTSISTKGTVESLLHSQLAFMERDTRPDLFDVKFLRDELYYYSRDENQFLRRRRTFVFALTPDLTRARFKDAELPVQRIVLVLGLLRTAVMKLAEWLSTDALVFEFVFIDDADGKPVLAQEQELVAMVLREQVGNGTALLRRAATLEELGPYCTRKAARSLCHAVVIGTHDAPLAAEEAVVSRVVVDGARPALGLGEDAAEVPDADDALECWGQVLERLLMVLV